MFFSFLLFERIMPFMGLRGVAKCAFENRSKVIRHDFWSFASTRMGLNVALTLGFHENHSTQPKMFDRNSPPESQTSHILHLGDGVFVLWIELRFNRTDCSEQLLQFEFVGKSENLFSDLFDRDRLSFLPSKQTKAMATCFCCWYHRDGCARS